MLLWLGQTLPFLRFCLDYEGIRFCYFGLYYILFSLLYGLFKCCYTTEVSSLRDGAQAAYLVGIARSSQQSSPGPLRFRTYITIRATLSCRQLAFRVPIFDL